MSVALLSFDPGELAGCFGKTAYVSKADALRTLQRIERSGRVRRKGRMELTTYRCASCAHFHIGSRP